MDAEIPVAAPNGSLRGRARLRLLSVKGFPVSQRSLPAVSQLPTDHVSMAEVSRRTRSARPCLRQMRAGSNVDGRASINYADSLVNAHA